ncbi:MAG TPA: SRPBCC family protein [Solirubrobacteraceae bacterium]
MTQRSLTDHENGLKTLLIRRTYSAPPDDVWDAITDPERLVRWFLPVSGDLREGGRFSLEGNASGQIVRCDRPRELALTWEFGGGSSHVTVRLLPEGEATVLELEHAPVPAEIVTNAGDMWGLGAGWELGLRSLEGYLAGTAPAGRAVDAMASAPPERLAEYGRMATEISDAWAAVIRAG